MLVQASQITQETTRRTTAQALVNKYVPWSMGVGFVPFPIIAAAGLVGIQIKMLADISKMYGVPFSESRVRSILVSLVGGVVPAAVSTGGLTGLVAAVPFVGPWLFPATLPLLSGAATYAIGSIMVQHFESGGTFMSFDAPEAKALFKQRFEEGKAEASKMGAAISSKLSGAMSI